MSVLRKLSSWFRLVLKRYPVKRYGVDGGKRVAVVYLSDFEDGNSFSTNRAEMRCMISAMSRLGLSIDVYDCRDKSSFFPVFRSYDLVFGFGKRFRGLRLAAGGVKVLYLTEGHPEFSLKNETNRVDAFNCRHSASVQVVRSGCYYSCSDLVSIDSVVCLGELHKKYLEEKLPGIPVACLSPTALVSQHVKTNFDHCGRVLWFGSRGVVHKGLDLLIESVPELGYELVVAGVGVEDIESLYGGGLAGVRVVGRLDVQSECFKEMIDSVDFAVFPSCSEAVPTSVLTIAACGVPVFASDKCGTKFQGVIDVSELDTVEQVRALVARVYAFGKGELELYARNQLRLDGYTLEDFEEAFEEVCRQVICEN